MRDIRCRKCNRLLMKGEVEVVEIKCPKCGYVQRIGREREVKGEAVQALQIA
ncbi:MAG: Com family DNA-binding transcriptional regulator [Alphaproteobacteria bacterium]|uniref:Com family DNA-binding transcriptional regulator n=1 Tax=Candidatus Nitrobium versatile TaxID=2884831 RepID=A0A953JA58_9BACT|nr:Com family DNA-binding transcriptional regulator [Candidatus Nitrobium versatile]